MITVDQTFINDFVTAYNNKFDTNIENQLALLPRPMSVNAFVTRVSNYVDMYVKEHCPNYVENLAVQAQKDAVYNAKLEQAKDVKIEIMTESPRTSIWWWWFSC